MKFTDEDLKRLKNRVDMDHARVIQVIECAILRRGEGTSQDPIRIVTQYFSLDGKLLAEVDPCKK